MRLRQVRRTLRLCWSTVNGGIFERLRVALARLGQTERARFIFRQAIEAAHQVNALNVVGLAALTLMEEVKDLSPATLHAAYRQVREWLANSQSPEIKLRLADAADRLVAGTHTELSPDEATKILLTEPGKIREKLRDMKVWLSNQRSFYMSILHILQSCTRLQDAHEIHVNLAHFVNPVTKGFRE